MKTKKHIADETVRASLAYAIAMALRDDSYNVMDYGACYYEGDTPSLDVHKMTEIIQNEINKFAEKTLR